MRLDSKNFLILALIITTLLKIFLAFTYDTADTGAMNFASALFLKHEAVYSNPQVFFSPPPFSLHVFAVFQYISQQTRIPFSGLWKLPAIFADIGIVFLIIYFLKNYYRKSLNEAYRLSLWYVLNPITWYVSGFHGQSESVWVFLVILAYYLLQERKSFFFSAFCMAVAIAYKLPAVLLFPLLVLTVTGFKKQVLYFLLVSFLVVASLFPEALTERQALIKQVFLYSSQPGIWGVTGIFFKVFQPLPFTHILPIISSVLKIVLLFFLTRTFVRYWVNNKRDFFASALTVVITFLLCTPGFGVQYLLWPLPFLILTQNKWLHWYTTFSAAAYFHTYGISFFIFNLVLNFLQRNFYYKTVMVYPYDLYYPIWFLLLLLVRKKHIRL